jgi:hypothetical protein
MGPMVMGVPHRGQRHIASAVATVSLLQRVEFVMKGGKVIRNDLTEGAASATR